MPTSQLFAQQLNESPEGFGDRLDTLLVGLGPIGLQTFLITRRSDAPGPRFAVTLVYTTPATVSLRAETFIGTPTNSAQSQANAFFAAHPTYRAHFVRDISDQRRGHLDTDALLIIYAESDAPNCGYDRSRLILVKATGAIAAGASGAGVRIYDGGSAEAIVLYNRSTIAWAQNVYGYAFPRAGDCVYDGVPTCCGP